MAQLRLNSVVATLLLTLVSGGFSSADNRAQGQPSPATVTHPPSTGFPNTSPTLQLVPSASKHNPNTALAHPARPVFEATTEHIDRPSEHATTSTSTTDADHLPNTAPQFEFKAFSSLFETPSPIREMRETTFPPDTPQQTGTLPSATSPLPVTSLVQPTHTRQLEQRVNERKRTGLHSELTLEHPALHEPGSTPLQGSPPFPPPLSNKHKLTASHLRERVGNSIPAPPPSSSLSMAPAAEEVVVLVNAPEQTAEAICEGLTEQCGKEASLVTETHPTTSAVGEQLSTVSSEDIAETTELIATPPTATTPVAPLITTTPVASPDQIRPLESTTQETLLRVCSDNADLSQSCTIEDVITSEVQSRMDALLDRALGGGGPLADISLLNMINKTDALPSDEGGQPPANTSLGHAMQYSIGERVGLAESSFNTMLDSPACPSRKEVVFLGSVPTEEGVPAYVVHSNKHNIKQGVIIEKCIKPASTCRQQVAPMGHTECRQKYQQRYLYVMDLEGVAFSFQPVSLPSCCSCYIRNSRNDLFSDYSLKLARNDKFPVENINPRTSPTQALHIRQVRDAANGMTARGMISDDVLEDNEDVQNIGNIEEILIRTKRDKLDNIADNNQQNSNQGNSPQSKSNIWKNVNNNLNSDVENLDIAQTEQTLGSVISNFVRGGKTMVFSEQNKKQLVCFTQNFGDDLAKNLAAAIEFNNLINDSSDWVIRNNRNTDSVSYQNNEANAALDLTDMEETRTSDGKDRKNLKEWLNVGKNDIAFLAKNLNKRIIPNSNSVQTPPTTLIPPRNENGQMQLGDVIFRAIPNRKTNLENLINGSLERDQTSTEMSTTITNDAGNIKSHTVSSSINVQKELSSSSNGAPGRFREPRENNFDESSVRIEMHGFKPILPNGAGLAQGRSSSGSSASFKNHNTNQANHLRKYQLQQAQRLNQQRNQLNWNQDETQKQQLNLISQRQNNIVPRNVQHVSNHQNQQLSNTFVHNHRRRDHNNQQEPPPPPLQYQQLPPLPSPQQQQQQQQQQRTQNHFQQQQPSSGVFQQRSLPQLHPPPGGPGPRLTPPSEDGNLIDSLVEEPSNSQRLQKFLFPRRAVSLNVQQAKRVFHKTVTTRRNDEVRLHSYQRR